MKLLAWNCRGLSSASAIHNLMGKIRTHSPEILFLSETKSHSAVTIVILNSLGYFLLSHVFPNGFKGGLLLAWRHGVDLECFLSIVNTINAWCYSDSPNKPWLLTCIYGPPEKN
jgi:exonuclease III